MKFVDKAPTLTDAQGFEKTPQGYLVVKATIARLGYMQYLGEELTGLDKPKGKSFNVYTEESELFSDKTIKSFEGMPITIEHPDDLEVKSTDWREKSVGHIQNVRRDGDKLACDAYIQDAAAIEYIEKSGVRETSIGHDSDLVERDGKIYKTNIVGNHVAVVPSGRADSTKLGDRKPSMSIAQKILGHLGVKKIKTKLNDSAFKALKQKLADAEDAIEGLAEDATPEEKAEAVQEVIDTVLEALGEASDLQEEVVDEIPADAVTDKKTTVNDADEADRVAELEAENESLKAENEKLKERVAELEDMQEAETVMNDAKARKVSAKLGDAKNSTEMKRIILVDSGALTKSHVEKLDHAALNAAYTTFLMSQKPKNNVGKALLADSKKESAKPAQKRLGGK